MISSIIIVSRDRKEELSYTLGVLDNCIDKCEVEVLVFLDGYLGNAHELQEAFKWVKWYKSESSIGASRARNFLCKKVAGEFIIGFDDDSHPLTLDFISLVKSYFNKYKDLGIITFKEVKGLMPKRLSINVGDIFQEDVYVKNFIGCGFAIKREIYFKTRGFPLWVDIYGEEDCLSMEVLNEGYKIIYTPRIQVNHRKDLQERKREGANYIRFRKHLRNTTFFYLIYYPLSICMIRISKLYLHNFRKYALTDFNYFKSYIRAFGSVIIKAPKVIYFRKPVKKSTLDIYKALPSPQY